MIRIRYYDEDEQLEGVDPRHDSAEALAEEYERRLLAPVRYPAKPFRDAESVRLLEESYGIFFADGGDLYSVVYKYVRVPLSALSTELKFALIAIQNSRDGRYTWYLPASEEVWDSLADMPFDILLVASHIEFHGGVGYVHTPIAEEDKQRIGDPFDRMDYQMEHCPYMGKHIDVMAKEGWLNRDDFYTKVPKGRRNTLGDRLYLGKDGRYYADRWAWRSVFAYFWKNDIRGILEYIDSLEDDRVRLVDIRQIYNGYEADRMLAWKNWQIGWVPPCIECMEQAYREGKIDEIEYKRMFKKSKEDGSYQRYLHYRDTFKVISHLSAMPEEPKNRKLPILMVDKNFDGTYLIHGGLTVRYSNYDELLDTGAGERSPGGERFAIVVDVDQLLDSARDISKTVCGFRILADSIEIYDSYDAIRLFGKALKEAYSSERCTVDDDFY